MRHALLVTVVVALACTVSAVHAQQVRPTGPWQTYDTANGEWRSYAGDIAGTKYSPLEQIDARNFGNLELAWEWMSVDNFVSKTMPDGSEWWAPLDTIVETLVDDTPNLYRIGHAPNTSGFQATPLMVGGVLYFNTPLSQGVAVDATTGETLWVFNPKSYEEGTTTMTGTWRQRGVAYWTDGDDDERIFWGTGNGYLVCVDAKTGQPCPDFGADGSGMVDAMVGIPRANRDERDYLNAMLYGIHSPPIVVRDMVIHGSQIADRRVTKEAVPGWVRAWNVRTGEHAWDFHTVPNGLDEYGVDTWLNESWRYSGNANVWSMLAGDTEFGYVYLPTGTATNDYYGADRLGDNLFAESIICVDVETGERVWHFQAVHHGLWDYDFPTHPEPGGPDGRRSGDQGAGAGEQTGLRLHVRPGDRRADLADRRAAGPTRDEHAGRGALADAAIPDEASALRLSRGGDRRSRRLHTRDPRNGGRGGQGLHARALVHAVEAPHPGGHARNPDAPASWRCDRVGRCRARPRHGDAVCPVTQPRRVRSAL